MAFPTVPSPVRAVHSQVSPDQLAWVNDDPSNDPHDGYPGPGWDAPRYEPSRAAEAQESGYARGYQLDWAAQPPAEMDSLLKLCWMVGKVQGATDRRYDDADREAYEADLAEWLTRPEVRDPSEIIRSVGCVAARTIGGAR